MTTEGCIFQLFFSSENGPILITDLDRLDEQVAALIQSLKLTPTWEEDVQILPHDEKERSDPENELKEIRNIVRLMRDNHERGLYEFDSIITKRLRPAIMCSFCCYEDLTTCREGGLQPHSIFASLNDVVRKTT